MASGNIVEMDGVYYRFRFEVVAREKLDSEIPQKKTIRNGLIMIR